RTQSVLRLQASSRHAALPAIASLTALRMAPSENGLAITLWIKASSPQARSRWSAWPVISRMPMRGWSRAVARASAMPSMTGMRMSVRRSSKAPCVRVSRSSAAAPSLAVTTSWPSRARARATRERRPASSPAIRMRAMRPSLEAGGEIATVEEAHQHLLTVARRRRESCAERQRLAGHQCVPGRQRGPGEDLVTVLVANRKSQSWHVDGALRIIDDRAVHHEHRHALLGLLFG